MLCCYFDRIIFFDATLMSTRGNILFNCPIAVRGYCKFRTFEIKHEPKREKCHTFPLWNTCLDCQRLKTDVGWKLIFFAL